MADDPVVIVDIPSIYDPSCYIIISHQGLVRWLWCVNKAPLPPLLPFYYRRQT